MLYFAGNVQFGSKKALERFRTQFDDLEEMDRAIMAAWSAVVRPQDSVILVGDFSCYSAFKTMSLLKQLPGKKHLVLGNNDAYIKDELIAKSKLFATVGDVLNYKDPITEKWFFVSHYPMLSWKGIDKGAIHVHSHLRSAEIAAPVSGDPLEKLDEGIIYLKNAYDAGIDSHGLAPVSVLKVCEDVKQGKCTVLTRSFFRVPKEVAE